MNTVPIIEASTVAVKKSINVDYTQKITVEIYGTATSAVVNFLCKSVSGIERPITGYRVSDIETGTTGGMNEVWQFDVPGIFIFIAELKSVSGGYVNVQAVW